MRRPYIEDIQEGAETKFKEGFYKCSKNRAPNDTAYHPIGGGSAALPTSFAELT